MYSLTGEWKIVSVFDTESQDCHLLCMFLPQGCKFCSFCFLFSIYLLVSPLTYSFFHCFSIDEHSILQLFDEKIAIWENGNLSFSLILK